MERVKAFKDAEEKLVESAEQITSLRETFSAVEAGIPTAQLEVQNLKNRNISSLQRRSRMLRLNR